MGSATGGLLELRIRILPGILMSVFFNVYCQVEVSATGRSITQKSLTVCVCMLLSVIRRKNDSLHKQ